jgi:hypothetical protein
MRNLTAITVPRTGLPTRLRHSARPRTQPSSHDGEAFLAVGGAPSAPLLRCLQPLLPWTPSSMDGSDAYLACLQQPHCSAIQSECSHGNTSLHPTKRTCVRTSRRDDTGKKQRGAGRGAFVVLRPGIHHTPYNTFGFCGCELHLQAPDMTPPPRALASAAFFLCAQDSLS